MHRNTWKAGERRTAKLFGTTRNALSGGNSGLTRSDSRHSVLFIESKHAKKHAVWTLHDDCKVKAKKEKKTPVIALHRKGSPGIIFCVHQENLPTFIRCYLDANPNEKIGVLSRMKPGKSLPDPTRKLTPVFSRKKRRKKKGCVK